MNGCWIECEGQLKIHAKYDRDDRIIIIYHHHAWKSMRQMDGNSGGGDGGGGSSSNIEAPTINWDKPTSPLHAA